MSRANAKQAPTEAEACRALAVAVIHQALMDAGKTEPAGFTRLQDDIDTARRFLTGTADWARSRRYWCELAGLEPQWLDKRIAELRAAGKL